MIVKNIINPQILSLITTFKCTASCPNCCFQCNPHRKESLSLEEMKSYVDQSIENFPTIKILVLTGGECTILGDNLFQIINYASRKALKVRIVSNGFWAISYEKALSIIIQLKEAGLSELNLSTGDEHQIWVPYDNIRKAALAALEQDLHVAISVESSKNSLFTAQIVRSDDKLDHYIKKGQLILQDSLWIKNMDKDIEALKDTRPGVDLNDGPCTNLFNSISVSPDSQMYSCCGLTCKSNPYLKLGSLKKHSIKKLYTEQFDDFMKIWLYTDGPNAINEFLCNESSCANNSYNFPHICSLCKYIFSKTDHMEVVKTKISVLLPTVLLKYNLIETIQKRQSS